GELLPVCTPALLAARHGAGLEGLTHLHMSSRPDAWRQWYQAQGKEYNPAISGGPRYELFTMSLAAVQAGLGVALMPRFLVQDQITHGDLVSPWPGALAVREAYFFSYPLADERSEALASFESWLAAAAHSKEIV